jgi:hypothetical protein
MRLFVLFLLIWVSVSVQAQQKEISYIETTKNWYYIYDESGKKIKTLYRNGIGDIKGWGKDFFVTKRGAFYLICDAEGKTLKTLGAQSVGEVVSVSSSTFTSRLGVWVYTWNKEGKKVQTRGAQ